MSHLHSHNLYSGLDPLHLVRHVCLFSSARVEYVFTTRPVLKTIAMIILIKSEDA